MNVLLIGGGGREHALAWKLAQSPGLGKLYAVPGNPGIAEHAELVDVDVADPAAVVALCAAGAIGLVVIGPEAPLVAGLGDALRAAGIAVFGPGKAAAQLEGSKGFTKALCQRAGIPTAAYSHHVDKDSALDALERFQLPVVIKADGLAAGKGVTVAWTLPEAEEAIDHIFGGGFGAAGAAVVIEDYLHGEEVSLFVLTDGATIVPFGSAQDHKRLGEGDTGPNTGGMGAYSPARVLTPELEARALNEIVLPTIQALNDAGTPYSGVLYAGLMLTEAGPQLIEYNVRFGDPECQVLMMRFDGDLLAIMRAVADARLGEAPPVRFAGQAALAVVMAAHGYPGVSQTGGAIDGAAFAEAGGAKVFHAGTAIDGGRLVAAGGRVLAVAATGANVGMAQAAAYRAVDAIAFPSGFCRRDIGWREVAREAAVPE